MCLAWQQGDHDFFACGFSLTRFFNMVLRKRQESVRDFERMCRTTCGNCPTGCGLKVYLTDGKIVDLFGDEEHPINKGSVCPKGMLTYFHLNNPDRLTKPQIRDRLSQPFRTVAWEEAIDFTARKITELAENQGKDSLCVYGGLSDPFDYLAGGTRFSGCLELPHGPTPFLPRPFGAAGAIQRMFGLPATQLQSNTPRDWCNSRCMLLYCCDPAATDPITFGPILDARDRGAALVVIDTKRTVTSSKATFSLRVKPGTQSVLLQGILHLLILKEYIDEDFIEGSTEGFDQLKKRTEPYSPEIVARTCAIEVAELHRLVDLLGRTKPLQVIAGDWYSRQFLTDSDLFGCAALVALRGSIGVPGGGVNCLSVSPFFTAINGKEGLVSEEPDASRQESRGVSLEALLSAPEPPISSLIWYGNAYPRLSGGKAVKAALEKLPLIVHLGFYPDETYRRAHVSIPSSFWLEYTGLLATNNGRAIQCHKQVIDPPGDCRSPREFWTDLSRSLNLTEFSGWSEGWDLEEPAAFYEFFLSQNPLTRALSMADLDPETNLPGGVLWPCVNSSDLRLEATRFTKGTVRGQNILFQRNQNFPLAEKRFPTESGRISFRSVADDNVLPSELLGDGERAFPLMLITGVPVDYVEQFGAFVPGGRERIPPVIKIHPKLADAIGIKPGEELVVENAKGSISAPAWLTDDVVPDVIWCPEDFGPDQPDGKGPGPKHLFDIPPLGRNSCSFAWVTVFKAGSDRDFAREKISRFVEGLQ
jgi:anaerobic selenocysteine-containing dehydrogenase